MKNLNACLNLLISQKVKVGTLLAVGTKTLHRIKRFPDVVTYNRERSNFGEKPTVTLDTNINHNVRRDTKTKAD